MKLWFIIFFVMGVLSESKIYDDARKMFGTDRDYETPSNRRPIFDSYIHTTDLEEFPDVCRDYESENCARQWLNEMDKVKKRNINRMANINYRYSTNISKENAKLKVKFQEQNLEVNRKFKDKLFKFKWPQYQSPQIRRIFKLISSTIESSNKSISEMLINISLDIGNIYNYGRPCYGECLEEGEAGIIDLFANERDYDKLAGFWSAWRNVTGRKIKNLFVERMNLMNTGARENGYSDAASFELKDDFDENNFNETVLRLYSEILPFYQQLHGYVRYCLAKVYPDRFDKTGPIPAHILGNVWGQQWNNILPVIKRCRDNIPTQSIHEEVNKRLQSLSVDKMFKLSEEFYKSIDMYEMTPTFWERSIVKKRTNRRMNCHGSAHNFANGEDFRIKMCTRKTVNHFTTIHHEMGHIEYFMAYKHLPYAFFGSANPGFHEAVGDTIALSVKTPTHLKRLGLIPFVSASDEFDMDYLLATALEKVVFLPYALTMDSYLWSVYNGSVSYRNLNKHWWDLRYRFQGLKPPIQRTEDDFDPGAKYHMAFGLRYIRYFISFIQQFQFYEAMCKLSGYHGPLHQCDFYQSKAAGRKLLEMLSMGKSQHWRDSLEILTGSRDIVSKSLMKFFDPLYKWLIKTNEKLNIPIGW